jgi:hypothetical protein
MGSVIDRQSKRVIACTGPRDFARFVVGSLCRQDLLCFLKVDLLFHVIAR